MKGLHEILLFYLWQKKSKNNLSEKNEVSLYIILRKNLRKKMIKKRKNIHFRH